ncbi:MAG: hypothetical protein ACRELY_18360 [Polyangiaceae bacterium]
MNPNLSSAEVDALLEVLHRGLILVRLAAMHGDAEKAEAISDAIHNVPPLLREGHQWGWSIDVFRAMFLEGLADRYPIAFAELSEALDHGIEH